MLSNYDIERMSHTLRLPFRNAVSKDELHHLFPSVGSYYVLLASHPSSSTVSHWVFVRVLPQKMAIYFDSFGIPYPPTEIEELLKRGGITHVYKNSRPIQDFASDKCGYFCLGLDIWLTNEWKRHKSVDENLHDYVAMFSDNRKRNDRIIMEFVRKYLDV